MASTLSRRADESQATASAILAGAGRRQTEAPPPSNSEFQVETHWRRPLQLPIYRDKVSWTPKLVFPARTGGPGYHEALRQWQRQEYQVAREGNHETLAKNDSDTRLTCTALACPSSST